MRARALLLPALAFAALAACGDDTSASGDAGFDAAVPGDASCATGEIGCGCADGTCATGTCVSGTCVDCSIGSADCACRSDGTCSAGLRCEGDRCEPCPAGQEGCACGDGDACDDGLVCALDVCVPERCEDGTPGCPCAAGDACDEGAFCDGTLCQACTADVAGCPCEDGACTGGLVCDAELCRAPRTCDDLVGAGTCGEHQRCDEVPGSDAVCIAEQCEDGYRWSTLRGRCVACVSEGCAAEPTCAPGLPTSLECGAHRTCVESDGGGECGGCEPGFADEDGECVDARTCGGTTCGDDEYCDTTRATPTCTPWPCADRATVVGSSGTCSITCERSCAVLGATGAYWPYAASDDSCICETVPGFYFDVGASVPVACDADGDGWVRDEVRDILDARTPDAALVANARCAIRAASAVELVDEHGIASIIESCEQGLLQDRTSGACDVLPLRLFETKRNDVEGEAARLGEAPPYASGGRRFRASELNSLTKACVSALGDYDHDLTEDVRQVQPRLADTSVLNERGRLRSFAHFVELYRTSWRPPADGSPYGHLVITERSRCAGFPLGYGADTAYDASDLGASYWRNCSRRRHPDFDADVAAPGYDFAQWSCGARAGSCPAASMPAHASHASFPDPDVELLRDVGPCELGGARAADGVWRGMGHHSQFQCVQIVADGTAAPAQHQRRRARFAATGDLVFNACRVVDCAGNPSCSESTPPSSGRDPHDPRITCTHAPGTLPAESAVGWAAVTYRPYGHVGPSGTPDGLTYGGGCVNEDAEWPALCPFPEFGRCASADASAFGRYHCYGWESLFLWGDDDTTLRRSELAWAPESGASANESVYNPASAPACM